MSRKEFPRSVRVAVIKRSMHNNVIYCEACQLPTKKFQVDHVIADSHGGKPVLENAELICNLCYAVKNASDTSIAADIKRQEANFLGGNIPRAKIQSRGFAKRAKEPKVHSKRLEPRKLYI